MAKVLMFDIETTDLAADFGFAICAAWKEVGKKKVHHVQINQNPRYVATRPNDRWVIEETARALSEADVVCGWYSSKFDWPFLQSQMVYHQLPPMPPVPHVDLWRTARYKMKLTSNRLANVSEFLGIEEKTPLKKLTWRYAGCGDPPSIRYVVKHCRQDVVVLEEAYLRMRPLITTHPNLNVIEDVAEGCPICGSIGKMQSRGYQIARVGRSQRFQCQECGGWSKGPPERSHNVRIR
jgi:uncharacterized protein YprB with RNaseH-like and TPR domain